MDQAGLGCVGKGTVDFQMQHNVVVGVCILEPGCWVPDPSSCVCQLGNLVQVPPPRCLGSFLLLNGEWKSNQRNGNTTYLEGSD